MRVAVSCVMDSREPYIGQGLRLLASLRAVGAMAGADVIVHHTGVDAPTLRAIRAAGAEAERIAPFGPGPASFCNKLRQLETLRGFDHCILLDTDMLFLRSPTALVGGKRLKARPVDGANPPQDVFAALLRRARLPQGQPFQPAFSDGAATLDGNFNGGLYVLPEAAREMLAEPWRRWSRFALDHAALLGRWAHHADQLGLAMALRETGLKVNPLPLADNFPSSLPAAAYATIRPRPICTFHYHSNAGRDGFPRPVGVPWIDSQLALACRVAGQPRVRPSCSTS